MPTPEELIKAGVHIGHAKSRWNPKMEPYVFGVRNNFHIIDVFKTIEKLEKAIEFLKETILNGGEILFVGTKVQTRDVVRQTAQTLKMPYVIGRWIGGLFTNFKVVRGRIKHFLELEKKKEAGEFGKYTKKEQLGFERKLSKLQEELGGIKGMEKLPAVLFVSDIEREKTAVLEAKKKNIPVVAIVDTDGDPTLADWPIPANDSAPTSLELIFSTIREELEGVKPRVVPVGPETEEESSAPPETGIQKIDSSNKGEGGRKFIASPDALDNKNKEK